MFIVTGDTSKARAIDGKAVVTTVESRFCMKSCAGDDQRGGPHLLRQRVP